MNHLLRSFLAALFLWLGLVGTASAEEDLAVLARVGPWPEISRLIGYGGRLWFANSVKGRNHNSADLYSYDPNSGRTRYEAGLFSQDAGRPLVVGGQLFWPFEDARFSLGWGHYMVTDGAQWRLGVIPSARAYHTHAMAALDGSLVAATSAWRAGFQVSPDGGMTWQAAYDHPTEPQRVSRVVALQRLGVYVLGNLVSRSQRGLLRFDGEEVVPLPGWPQDRAVIAMTLWQEGLYGLVRHPQGTQVWRSDGTQSERLGSLPADWDAAGLTAGTESLWAVGRGRTSSGTTGRLWRSRDGRAWREAGALAGGNPREVAVFAGQIYVAGAGDDGRGILWGPQVAAAGENAAGKDQRQPPREVKEGPRQTAAWETAAWETAAAELREVIAAPDPDPSHRARLRDLVYQLASNGAPAATIDVSLASLAPAQDRPLIGGAVTVAEAALTRWILLWGNALAGSGRVPIDVLRQPWTAAANRAEKYFDPQPIAIWAAGLVGQRDRETLAALITRLEDQGDPPWLKGDIVAALTRLTGQRFAHDYAAWAAWWQGAAESWP